MTETLSIPLNKLVPWDGNVRKTSVSEGIEELSASIAAHGLLQAPIVRKIKGGKYAVVAGQRRLRALKQLAEKGTIAADLEIPCQLVAAEADAGEISLAENVVRVAMHPADEFEAFRDLVERGSNASDVALRFGVSETVVLKRLKLGRLSPAVLEAYRAGDIGLEQAQAFAITDNREAQERVLAELPEWNRSPGLIRQRLTEGEVSASDKRVRFVGLAAYEAAGGAVRRDLFDDEDSGTIVDAVLLERMVAEKLSVAAEAVRGEGWAWVRAFPDYDRSALAEYRRSQPVRIPLTAKQESQRESLSEEYDALADSQGADDGDEDVVNRLSEIERMLDELEEAQYHWPDEVRASAGAVVAVAYDGDLVIERGFVAKADEAMGPDASPKAPRDGLTLAASLVEDLTAQKSAALRVTLSANPQVALAAIVHALALPVFGGYGVSSCLQVSMRAPALERQVANADSVRALHEDADAEVSWARRLPEEPDALWHWCLAQPQDTLIELLAFLAGRAVDAVLRKSDRADCSRLAHADDIARAVSLDMTAWFTPDAQYFSGLSAAQIVSALCEAKGVAPAPAWMKMKKTELAALAAREIGGTGWLPGPLRVSGHPTEETGGPLSVAA